MPARWLTVARIVKTQGRRGEVAAEILTDFPDRLLERRAVWLWDGRSEPRAVRVERIWPHKNFLVFELTGFESLAQAKALVGLEIQIPRAEATPLGHSAFYLDELEGCRVVERSSGAELGRVRELISTGGTPLLAVEAAGGKEILIPFAEEFCPRIAPGEKLIEVVLPDGLRDLNE
ncbi:MAG: 16S rRNA processing protein RimM [Acidobacteria bacterium]|nr:16S rRNA processing protein RimM [Acidobacteriota bacterium]